MHSDNSMARDSRVEFSTFIAGRRQHLAYRFTRTSTCAQHIGHSGCGAALEIWKVYVVYALMLSPGCDGRTQPNYKINKVNLQKYVAATATIIHGITCAFTCTQRKWSAVDHGWDTNMTKPKIWWFFIKAVNRILAWSCPPPVRSWCHY